MILGAINWLTISIDLLLVVFVVVCLLMSLLILMQRPKQEGLGAAFGGGVTDQVFGARTTNVLQKGTVYLGSGFFIISLTLAILIGKQTKERSLLEPVQAVAEKRVEVKKESPVAPKSLAEELPVVVEEAPKVVEEVSKVIEEAAEKATEEPAIGGAAVPDAKKVDKSE